MKGKYNKLLPILERDKDTERIKAWAEMKSSRQGLEFSNRMKEGWNPHPGQGGRKTGRQGGGAEEEEEEERGWCYLQEDCSKQRHFTKRLGASLEDLKSRESLKETETHTDAVDIVLHK